MKTALVVLFLLCAAMAFGQSGGAVLTSQPQILEIPSHPEHASPKAMAAEQSLLVPSGPTQAHGTRPLWELVPPKHEVPLGDVARALKNEHSNVKKSKAVWEN